MNLCLTLCEYVRFVPLTLQSFGVDIQDSRIFGKGMGGIKLDGYARYIRFPADTNIYISKSQSKNSKLKNLILNIFNCISSINHLPIEIYTAANPHHQRDNSIECHQTHRNRPLRRSRNFSIPKQAEIFQGAQIALTKLIEIFFRRVSK